MDHTLVNLLFLKLCFVHLSHNGEVFFKNTIDILSKPVTITSAVILKTYKEHFRKKNSNVKYQVHLPNHNSFIN